MHELSVSMSIVAMATKEVKEAHAQHVSRIELEIGTLSGIDLDALYFAWDHAIKNTVLENAERVINEIHARARCLECDKQYPISHFHDNCPYCGSYFKDVEKGKELKVKSITVEL